MRWLAILVLGFAPSIGEAGLYYSGEVYHPLPSQWRGFLLDHRALRMIGQPARGSGAATLLREQYNDAASTLHNHSKRTPVQSADLGALYLRLGQVDQAIEVLRAAQRNHPDHFRVTANLGTAWQLKGDLSQARRMLQAAVQLAPAKWAPAERLHLRLVSHRLRQTQGGLDDLFNIHFDGNPATAKKLPKDAIALTQQLALWLPADGALLWQLGELAYVTGEVRSAAAMLDGCVTEFGMSDRELRQHRQQYRSVADQQQDGTKLGGKGQGNHESKFKPVSKNPLVRKFDFSRLPPIKLKGVNQLPWVVLAETRLDRQFRPTFPEYLKKLDGKKVTLTGFMQPLGDNLEITYFLFIEYPIGCWFCEAPEPIGMVLAELAPGKSMILQRDLVKVEGTLRLNPNDPEDFLYTLKDVEVRGVD